jgi:hypothetical protein
MPFLALFVLNQEVIKFWGLWGQNKKATKFQDYFKSAPGVISGILKGSFADGKGGLIYQ